MQALCQACNEWSVVESRSRYCAFCGTKYDIDIALLVERENAAENIASAVSNGYTKGVMAFAVVVLLVPCLLKIFGIGGYLPIEDIALLGVIAVFCWGFWKLHAYVRWRKKVLYPKFPDVFANPRWR